jgi:transposase
MAAFGSPFPKRPLPHLPPRNKYRLTAMTNERRLRALEQRRRTAAQLLAAGTPQAEVARRMGVSRQSVSHWEKLRRKGGMEALRRSKSFGRPPKRTGSQHTIGRPYQMSPNFALRRLADRVQPGETGMHWVHDQLAALERRVNKVFPRSSLVPIGSYSRGTAIAVHSNVDTLVVLPREWQTWGACRVTPQMIMQRMAQNLGDQHCNASIRRDGRAVTLSFEGVIHTLDVLPGFSVRPSKHHPVYAVPGADLRWVQASPQYHDALFARANIRSGGKLRAMSRLVKTWGTVAAPCGGISSLYIDMMLATSPIASGDKSYGECLSEFFKMLLRRGARGLPDPAGGSGVIPASSSIEARERLWGSARAATDQVQTALDAQTRGENRSARRQWKAVFNRRL